MGKSEPAAHISVNVNWHSYYEIIVSPLKKIKAGTSNIIQSFHIRVFNIQDGNQDLKKKHL